jgi:nudix motif 8
MATPIKTPPPLDVRGRALLKSRLDGLARRAIRDPGRRAAVLIPLCAVGGEPAVLLTRRSEEVGTHKGQVSFPGGMADPEDPDLIATALRETEEELGLSQGGIEILGLFHDVRAITGVPVTPVAGFVGELGDLSVLAPNPREIDRVFALTLAELRDPSHREIQDFGPRGRLPVFTAGPDPVWGLTAYILDHFLSEVVHGLSELG